MQRQIFPTTTKGRVLVAIQGIALLAAIIFMALGSEIVGTFLLLVSIAMVYIAHFTRANGHHRP
jgi:hypothetical protein